MSTRKYIARKILSAQQFELPDTAPVKFSEALFSFLKRVRSCTQDLAQYAIRVSLPRSGIHVTCIVAFSCTVQLMQLYGRAFDVAFERRSTKQKDETFRKIYGIGALGDRDKSLC